MNNHLLPASFKSPKLLALGVPLVFLGQCAPDGCAPGPAAAPAATTYTVADVIDGDTIDVNGPHGEFRVRLIGIDAPEVGQCGADVATVRLKEIVLGQTVALTSGARDDVDIYGRALRYVETATTDAGMYLIQNGVAIARYDSRDGYGSHTREAQYVAADAASPVGYGCAAPPPATTPPPAITPPPAGNCHPAYVECLPVVADLDCPQIGHLVHLRSIGNDPYRLDGSDNDGLGCESFG